MTNLLHVKGLADLQKILNTLPAKVEKNIMRGALRAGANVVKKQARANINHVSGKLARGLKVSTGAKGGLVKASLKVALGDAFYAKFVEFGTRPHLISVQDDEKWLNKRLSEKRGRDVLVSMTTINRSVLLIGNHFVGPTVSHPGARPHPFLRPALDSESRSAVIAVGNYIKNRLATKNGIDTSHIELSE